MFRCLFVAVFYFVVSLLFFSEMNFVAKCPGPPSGPPCNFVGRGARLAAANRAVRGHALRVHGMAFEATAHRLVPLSPEELDERLAAFRLQQLSSGQRRGARELLAANLGPTVGLLVPATGFVAGHLAGGGTGMVDPSAWLPDLSPGLLAPVPSTSAVKSAPA